MISFVLTRRTTANQKYKRRCVFFYEAISSKQFPAEKMFTHLTYGLRFGRSRQSFQYMKRPDGSHLSLDLLHERVPYYFRGAVPEELFKQWKNKTKRYRQRNCSQRAKTDII